MPDQDLSIVLALLALPLPSGLLILHLFYQTNICRLLGAGVNQHRIKYEIWANRLGFCIRVYNSKNKLQSILRGISPHYEVQVPNV